MSRAVPILAATLALTLAACGGNPQAGKDLNQLDAELVGNAADPALASALEDPIMADPSLAAQADGTRNPPDPGQTPLPSAETLAQGDKAPNVTGLAKAPEPQGAPGRAAGDRTLGQLAREQATKRKGAAPCSPDLDYSFAWAAKLPPELPVYPKAQVAEAAGNDAPGCRARIVSFTTPAVRQVVTDYYFTLARKARFSARHVRQGGDYVLEGQRRGDYYYLVLADADGGGTAVDMIVTTAR